MLTALEKLPADRFASAAQFAEALSRPTFTAPATAPMAAATQVAERAHGRTGARVRRLVVPGGALLVGAVLALAAQPSSAALPRHHALRPVRFVYTGSDSARVAPDMPVARGDLARRRHAGLSRRARRAVTLCSTPAGWTSSSHMPFPAP